MQLLQLRPQRGKKRKSEGEGDEDRAELAPSDQRSEAQKRKATEDAEGMIDEIIAQEREGFIASVEHKERPTCDLEDDLWEEKFYDENSGKELPPEGVRNARMEEIEVIKSMGVWEPIDRPPGEKVIGTRWVDINKGDSLHMKLRSRLVAQELKRKKGNNEDPAWTDFFAAHATVIIVGSAIHHSDQRSYTGIRRETSFSQQEWGSMHPLRGCEESSFLEPRPEATAS